MPKFHQTIIISTLNGDNPLDKRDILTQFTTDATAYHQRGESTGITYYGNNYLLNFFESSEYDIEQHKIDSFDYPNYHAAELIYSKRVYEKSFNSWQMKYTQNDPLVQAFLAKHGWISFNPYLLKDDILQEFIDIIMAYADADITPAITPASISGRTSLRPYVFGTIIVVCVAWLIFMALGYFDYLSFAPFEINWFQR